MALRTPRLAPPSITLRSLAFGPLARRSQALARAAVPVAVFSLVLFPVLLAYVLVSARWLAVAHAESPAPASPAKPVPAKPAPVPPSPPPSGHVAPSGSEHWNDPFAPFHAIGNIHYVGAAGVSSFWIDTPAGAILLDGGLVETAPRITQNIGALGFRVQDVKYLLNSHAHFDHAGGLAALKKASGAQLVASQGDAARLRAGGPAQPAVAVDRVVNDGDTVELGGTVLTARVTPGHTPGCTTWTMTTTDAGKAYRVVFYCSTSVVDRLVDNAQYPSIAADYERSFPVLRELPCDVFFAPHPDMFQMAAKRERLIPGAANPFIDPAELRRYVDRSEQQFRDALARERQESAAPAAAPPAAHAPAAPKAAPVPPAPKKPSS